MPTALEHRQAIAEAVSALNKALLDAHGEGITVYINCSDTCSEIRFGDDQSLPAKPANIRLESIHTFVDCNDVPVFLSRF